MLTGWWFVDIISGLFTLFAAPTAESVVIFFERRFTSHVTGAGLVTLGKFLYT